MNTAIWDTLNRLYEKAGLNLISDIEYFDRDGYVFRGEDYFIMGIQVGEGWYVQAAVGRIEKFLDLMPYYLPYIGWRREGKHNDECVWYRTDVILRKLNYARRNTSAAQAASSPNEGHGRTEFINPRVKETASGI